MNFFLLKSVLSGKWRTITELNIFFFFFCSTQAAVSECDYTYGGSLLQFGDGGTGDAEKLVC